MAVWWVFQNESFERSRKGGYLWAPLVDKRGNKKNHWEYVDQVKKGDVVTFLTEEMSFGTRMVSCYELLLCMTKNEFISNFKAI